MPSNRPRFSELKSAPDATLCPNSSDSAGRAWCPSTGKVLTRALIFNSRKTLAVALFAGFLLAGDSEAIAQSAVSTADDGPATPVLVWGHERLAWDQYAPTTRDLGRYVFTALIDGQFQEPLENVACASIVGDNGYECSSRLPRMAPGSHSIQVAARLSSDATAGPLSTPLQVTLQARSTADVNDAMRRSAVGGGHAVAVDASGAVGLSSLPDGRILISYEDGRIVAVTDGAPTVAVDLKQTLGGEQDFRLLALAVDPRFAITRFVFAAYATETGLTIARLREVNGTLGDHAVVRAGLPRSIADPATAIAIGADRKLYVATGGSDGDRLRDPYASQVLRLNLDGSTPDDSAAAPIVAAGMQRPASIGWSDDGSMWIVGANGKSEVEARSIPSANPLLNSRIHLLPTSPPDEGRLVAIAREGEIVLLADDRRSLLLLVPAPGGGEARPSKWLVRGELGLIHAIGQGAGESLLVLSDRGLSVIPPR